MRFPHTHDPERTDGAFRDTAPDRIVGILSGFDRLLFRGTLRSIAYVGGLDIFLSSQHVLYKDFATFALGVSDRLKAHAEAVATHAGRPFRYVVSSRQSKEDLAREILRTNPVVEGLICVLSCVEPCQSFTIRRDRATHHLQLDVASTQVLASVLLLSRPGLWADACAGADLAPVHDPGVCLRARVAGPPIDARAARISAGRQRLRGPRGPRRAQALADQLIDWPWQTFCSGSPASSIRGRVPNGRASSRTLDPPPRRYATDVLFRDADTLTDWYPRLLQHAIAHFGAVDVLRFLGRRLTGRFSASSAPTCGGAGGTRIKHWVDENSSDVRQSDAPAAHRNDAQQSAALQRPPRRPPPRAPRRRLVTAAEKYADLRRWVDIARAANARYLDALSVVGEITPSHHLLDPVSHRVTRHGRPFRPLRPISPDDAAVFRSCSRGSSSIQGIRNADLRRQLLPDAETTPLTRRQASGRVSRLLRLLRPTACSAKSRYALLSRHRSRTRVMTTALTFREPNRRSRMSGQKTRTRRFSAEHAQASLDIFARSAFSAAKGSSSNPM